ncbi:hypothetical protein J1614_007858 [Plenodomus biglobosus]|nr:hypothetical protein J1614_007858 [Plenodomus biglobosus]
MSIQLQRIFQSAESPAMALWLGRMDAAPWQTANHASNACWQQPRSQQSSRLTMVTMTAAVLSFPVQSILTHLRPVM